MHRSSLAILSDIHSNLDAFEAVTAELDADGVDNVVCLGDVVGYAAYPEECINRVRQRGWHTVLGNHDDALDKPLAKGQMNDVANAGVRLAEKQVSSGNRAWLDSLPMKLSRTHAVFAHASLDSPEEWPYLIDVEFRRIPYDVKAAQKAIRKAGLPAFAARRLAQGF